jgi:hypothetical protein
MLLAMVSALSRSSSFRPESYVTIARAITASFRPQRFSNNSRCLLLRVSAVPRLPGHPQTATVNGDAFWAALAWNASPLTACAEKQVSWQSAS